MKKLTATLLAACYVLTFYCVVQADQQVAIQIEGMTCRLCPLAVSKALSATQGVKEVEVSYEQAKAKVIAADSVENQILLDAVSKAGPYKGRVIERRRIKKP